MKVCFPLLITGTFIDKIISYSMWQFIYGSAKNVKLWNFWRTKSFKFKAS